MSQITDESLVRAAIGMAKYLSKDAVNYIADRQLTKARQMLTWLSWVDVSRNAVITLWEEVTPENPAYADAQEIILILTAFGALGTSDRAKFKLAYQGRMAAIIATLRYVAIVAADNPQGSPNPVLYSSFIIHAGVFPTDTDASSLGIIGIVNNPDVKNTNIGQLFFASTAIALPWLNRYMQFNGRATFSGINQSDLVGVVATTVAVDSEGSPIGIVDTSDDGTAPNATGFDDSGLF